MDLIGELISQNLFLNKINYNHIYFRFPISSESQLSKKSQINMYF